MANKAAKQIARRNIAILNRTHLISLSAHVLFLLIRILLYSSPRSSYILYGVLSSPSIVFELYLERLGRPSFASDGEMRRSGEDLEAKGLTEYMWDIVYWTWGCVVAAAVLGDRAWWLWAIIPLYSAWLAYTTFMGVRQGMGGLTGGGGGVAPASGTSNRQKKMEKREGHKIQYR
ncbi:hypothetical protein GP486_002667 [Trichoglossum hirsutum]|uniref:DUF788 domain-containing protein n=1 Tax=Trichoglossum hirsutum TaxID=265104 RepID=A0A9P8LED2_9PEZI|nr:hypothetical protein GP486_002667 [Trichoglossum hirsutum]